VSDKLEFQLWEASYVTQIFYFVEIDLINYMQYVSVMK